MAFRPMGPEERHVVGQVEVIEVDVGATQNLEASQGSGGE